MGVPRDHWNSDPFYFTQGMWYIYCMPGDQKDIFRASRYPQEPGMLPGGWGQSVRGKSQGKEAASRAQQQARTTDNFFFFFPAPLGKQSLSHLFGTPFPWSFCQQFQAKGIGKSSPNLSMK